MKEIVPSVFNNGEGVYLRLECFEDGNLLDRITIKVDKMDEENLIDFFDKLDLKNRVFCGTI